MPEKIIIESDSEQFDEEGRDRKKLRVLTFEIGGELCCVDIRQALEVVPVRQMTRVPNAPGFVSGIMNLRGDVVALVDIRYFFGLERKDRNGSSKALVTDVSGGPVGIVVDRIRETVDIDESSIEPPLANLAAKSAMFTRGQIQLGDEIFALLDLKGILSSEEMEKLAKGELS